MSQKFVLTPLADRTCAECPQHRAAGLNQVTTEYYGRDVDVMFIAEAPGASENQAKRPFIGRSGRILRRTVQRANHGTHVGVAYGNVVRCRPTKQRQGEIQDRLPTAQEMKCCRPNIWRDISKLKPKVIVLCGDTAARALAVNLDGTPIGDHQKILSMRGHDFYVMVDGVKIPAIVTYHFSYVMRTPTVASVFYDDVARALRRARGELNQYPDRGDVTKMLTTVPQVRKFLHHLATGLTKRDVVAFDYENEGLQRLDNRVLSVSFAYEPNQAYFIPYAHPDSPFNGEEQRKVKKLLRRFFRIKDPSFRSLVAHNAKFECLSTVDQFGTHILCPMEDTMQRAHALNEDRKDAVSQPYGLKALVEEQLGFYHYADADIRPVVALRNEGKLAEADVDALAQYNGMDAYCTWRLYRWQNQWAKAEHYGKNLRNLSFHLQGGVARFLSEMERNGLRADKKQVVALASNDSEIVARQKVLLQNFYAMDSVKEANKRILARKDIPTKGIWGEVGGSAAPGLQVFQIGEKISQQTLFFDVLDLAPAKINRKTGSKSVGKEFFEKHEGVPEIDLFADYMKLQKIRTTYIESIHKFLQTDPDMRDQRIRPHFKPTGTITGRLSSSEPNMLNVPSRSKDAAAKAIKRLYIVDPGYVLVCADYSQAEVRWLAEATQDPSLIEAFCSAYAAKQACRINPTKENRIKSKLYGDFHRHTASMIHGIPLDKVTKEQRTATKAIVFGIVYGMSAQGLAQRLKITIREAEAFMDSFFARFPQAKQWLDDMETSGYNDGLVLSPIGRRKLVTSKLILGNDDPAQYPEHLRYLKSHRNHELRVCRNAPIQGVASDTNLLACCTLLDHILDHKLDWRIINTVYDSIMIEVPFVDARACVETAQGIMEDPKLFAPFGVKPRVPFAADFSAGITWGDQLDIAYDEEAWEVKCQDCGKVRVEEAEPKNRRCEECGSKQVRKSIVTGTLDQVMHQIDHDHNLSEYWA